MNDVCSIELLTNAVANRLSADEEAALYDHLERCEACCARMEQLAGGEQWQQEAASLLTSDELDAAVPEPMVWSEVDFSVEHLDPSDDANVLGQLGGYDVLAIVGRGGMGVVLKAFDRELKRFVAIKALSPHLAHSSVARKRFAREAQAAAAVVNPHVIAIHHVQPTGRLPFLIMPLLTGESLAQRLKSRAPLELTEVLRIGMQAAVGLAAAHDQGLVHRDVKPANIFLEKGVERVVITDFGLARAADDVSMTRLGIVAGTPEYMSPQQARGEALDGRSDLFSLGCVLYEMATGVSPFRSDSTIATLRRIVDDKPAAIASLAPELPPWFGHIVERLLSKDPAQRFASASEVSQLLEACLSHLQQPTSVPLPASLVAHANGRRSFFNSTRKGMLALLGTVGMTLLGMVLWQAAKEHDSSGWRINDDRQNANSVVAAVAGDDSASNIRIAGKCVDEEGMPVAGATIDLYPNADSSKSLKTTQTRSDGSFDLGDFPDPELTTGSDVNYRVVGRREGKAVNYAAVLAPSLKADSLELVLGLPAKLIGTVTGPDGSPLKNARVRVAGYPWIDGVHGAITNKSGEYVLERIPALEHPGVVRRAIPNVPGGFELIPIASKFLIVDHEDFGSLQPTFAECPATIDVCFDEPAKITGRVVDEYEKPIPGIKVTVRPSRALAHREALVRAMKSGVSQGTATTNDDGQYSLAIQHNGAVEINVIDPLHFAKTVSDVFVRAGEAVPVPDIAAIKAAFVSGRIVDVDTDNTVACPKGVRLRVNVMGEGALTGILVRPDGTYRLPVLPGTSYVYFSSNSLDELTKTWDVLEHPNALTAKNYPVTVAVGDNVQVNFPIKLNKAKLEEDLQCLQGEWELQSGMYVASGNSRLPLTADHLVDGNSTPLRFSIHGDQRIGATPNICSAAEADIAMALCGGIAVMTLDAKRSPPSLTQTQITDDKRFVIQFLYRLKGDQLELVCHSPKKWHMLPESLEPRNDAFILVANRVATTPDAAGPNANVLAPANGVDPSAFEQPQRVLNVSQVMNEGRALNESGEVVVVRFRVANARKERVGVGHAERTGPGEGVWEHWWVLSSEKAPNEDHPLAFRARITTKALDELKKNGIEDIAKHFVGKILDVEGPVQMMEGSWPPKEPRSDIPGDPKWYPYYSTNVYDLERIQEAKAVAPPVIDGAKTPAGALSYEGTVLEWVGGDRDRLWEVDDVVYKPVPNATLRLYRVSPITNSGPGYQFEEIGVFQSDNKGRFQVNIPDDLKQSIPTPHTKEWDDWESLLLVTTSAPGFATESTTLNANRGLDYLALSRGTSIKGRLVDEYEKPIVGAHVIVNDQSRSARREEMDEWLRQTSKAPLPKATFDPGDTTAILAARTHASIALYGVQWIPTQIEGVITDKDGRFMIDGIGPDDILDLSVECFGYNNANIKVIGRDIETVYSRDPFGSGENIAVHGRTLQATLIASDRGSPHSRHRVIKGERTKDLEKADPSDALAKEESGKSIEKPTAVEQGLSPDELVPDPTSEAEESVSGVPTKLDSQSSIKSRDQLSNLVESWDAKPELPPLIQAENGKQPAMSLQEVYKKVRSSIVRVDWGQNADHNGTIISPDGHVLVFDFVVVTHSADETFVTLDSGKRYRAKRLGWSSQWCVGLLKIESNEVFPFARMASDLADLETDYLGIGFPYNPYRLVEQPDVRWGTIAERFGSKCFRVTNRLPLSHGTGVFDSRGYLVGICTHTSSSGYYCTSSVQVASLWDELTSRKNVDEKMLFEQKFDLSKFGESTKIKGTGVTTQQSAPHAATVRLREKSREFGWSGVVVTADGIVVTCAHHACPVGTELVAELPDGRGFPAKVLGMNPVTDIGLVQILIEKGQTLPCVKIGRSTTLEGQEAATALSFPADHKSRTPLQESGQIAAYGSPGLSFIANDKKTKWICAAFAEEGRGGQSGSGLFNANGELVGIFIIGGKPRHFVRIEAVLDQWKWLTSDDVFRPNPKPSSAVRATFRATTANVRPSVVEVLCDDKRCSIGVVVGADGRILTKLSELHGNLSCRASDGAKYAATIIKSSKDNDLALIKIEPNAPLTALSLDTSILERFAHIAAVLPTGKRPWNRGMSPMDDSPIIGIVTEAAQRIAPIAGSLGLFSDDPNGVRLTGRVVRTVGLELNDVVQSINGKPTPNLKAFEKVMHPFPESVIGFSGDKVSVKFVRGEEILEKECVLAETPRESLDEESPRRSGFTRAYDSDLEIYQAECGAPVLDADGKWIGIAIATRGTGYVYVLNSIAIQEFLTPSR